MYRCFFTSMYRSTCVYTSDTHAPKGPARVSNRYAVCIGVCIGVYIGVSIRSLHRKMHRDMYKSLLQNIVYFLRLFCKRDLYF